MISHITSDNGKTSDVFTLFPRDGVKRCTNTCENVTDLSRLVVNLVVSGADRTHVQCLETLDRDVRFRPKVGQIGLKWDKKKGYF